MVTQQPGYAVTERITRDVAAENRLRLFQVNRIIARTVSRSTRECTPGSERTTRADSKG